MSERPKDFPGDAQLSALYREHARDEPSVEIDERILAAARAAVTVPVSAARRSWWQRWRTTLALTTTLTLTLTLALPQQRSPGPSRREAEVAPPRPVAPGSALPSAARDVAAPAASAPAGVTGDAVAGAGAAAVGVAPRPQAREESSVGQRLAQPAGGSGPRPADGDTPHREGRLAGGRQEVVPESSAAAGKEGNALPAAAAAAPAAASAEQQTAAVGQPPAARQQARAVAKSRADDGRSADDWLEEIRALRREGRNADAAKQLADFRRVHPDYPLPEEFRQ